MTAEELKGGHVSFQMDENLVVDADVTGEEKYRDGLSSYYLKVPCETDKASEQAFLKEPTVSRHNFGEWEGMLNKIVPGKFEGRAFKVNEKNPGVSLTYRGEDGSSYLFRAQWSNYKRGVPEKTGFNSAMVTIDAGSLGDGNALLNTAKNIRRYVRDYHGTDVPDYLQDAGGGIGQVKSFLEEMSGRPVHEGYDFCIVNRETAAMLNEQPWMSAEETVEEDYAALFFYYDVDGLPFRELRLNYSMGNGKTAGELCYWSSMEGDRLTGFPEHEQVLVAGRDGILYLECSNQRDIGEVYREKQPVVNPNVALKQVKEHYGRQLAKEECTITEIGLVYTAYFSDGADGQVQPVVSPFWAVKVYDRGSDVKRYVYFVYDAYTGECVSEGVQ